MSLRARREPRAARAKPAASGGARAASHWLVALWFGLATGLLEGTAKTLLRGAPGWAVRASPEILWIAPAFNTLLFLLGAAVWELAGRLVPGRLRLSLFVAGGTAISAFGILLFWGGMHQVAALLLSLGIGAVVLRRAGGNRSSGGVPALLGRSLPFLAVATLAALLVGWRWEGWREGRLLSQLPPAPGSAPNVLLVTLDTLRADHLSSYGYPRRTTPRLDALARGGVLFERAFANSSWTLPAHASLFTGRLPAEHGADWWVPLDARFPTLAEALAERGYRTAAFAANTSYVAPEWGLGRGFTRFQVYGGSLADDAMRTLYGRKLALNVLPRLGFYDIPGRKRAEAVNAEFLEWLDRLEGRPFFAFLNCMDVHDPYCSAPEEYLARFGPPPRGDLVNFQFQAHAFRTRSELAPAEIQREIDGYDGCLAYLDAQLGALFAELARRGLDRNTLVIITSDHGEAFGEHGLFGHGNSLYLESLHVPLIVSWPGRVPAGARVSKVVSLHRIPATVMELLGPAPAGRGASFPGSSLAPLWARGRDGAEEPEPVAAEVSAGRLEGPDGRYPAARGGLRSVVTSRWHYIVSGSGDEELYAWPEDPREARDLKATDLGREAVRGLRALLERTIPGGGRS